MLGFTVMFSTWKSPRNKLHFGGRRGEENLNWEKAAFSINFCGGL